jgi:aromatic-L-amino-acid decarboxylase
MDNQNILDRIQLLESSARLLEPLPSDRQALQDQILSYTNEFLDNLPDAKAYEINGYQPNSETLRFSITGDATDIKDLTGFLGRNVDGPGLNPASGGHLGYIPGGGVYAASLGDYIAAVTNRYAGVFYAGPGAVRIENALIDWAGSVVGYQPGFGGNITTGGSIANLIAIVTARTAKNILGAELERTVIYLSFQAHHSITKSIRLAGLGECILRFIPVDEYYRIDVALLNAQLRDDLLAGLKPFMIIANAGSTDTGSVDPLADIAAIAARYGVWFHVDAAYGGFFLLTDHGKQKLEGIHLADSVILDPHKGLFLPYGNGMVLVKDIKHLLMANSYEANYMQDTRAHDHEYSPADLSPELSRNFRGLRMWLPLKLHGLAPFKDCIAEKRELALYFYHKIKELGFEMGPEPDLSVVVFRWIPADEDADAFNKALIHHIQSDGRIFLSSTVLNGSFMIRFAALSFRTHLREVTLLLDIITDYLNRQLS